MELLEFAVDYSVLFDILSLIVVLSFFVERALSVIFESALFISWYDPVYEQAVNPNPKIAIDAPPKKKKKGIKELISIIVSVILVYNIEFNALAILMKNENVSEVMGYFITGLIIAGGSKASIKLFSDIMDFRSTAEKRRKDFNNQLKN
jgi:hypothetical protein